MTTYYVRKTGSDSNAGTSAGAAWQTIGKALGASGIASGDTVYIGAGTYREAVTVAMTSAVAETFVIGDVDGAQTGDAGEVIWTAFTTNDTTAPAASSTVNLNGRDFLTFQRLTIVGGNVSASCVDGQTAHSTNCVFRECAMYGYTSRNCIVYTGLADTAANWTIDRCSFLMMARAAIFTLPTSASADYDVNILFQNCLFLDAAGGQGITVTASGAGSFKAGGVDILNNTFIGPSTGVQVNSANISTSIPCTVYNCIFHLGAGTGLSANTSGQITENYNLIYAATPRTNVSAGANSQTVYAFLLEIGQNAWIGGTPRPFGTPLLASPLLGFGNQAGGPTVDFANRTRPAGGASTSNAIGYLERHDTAAKETSVTQAGSNAVKITGPGDHDIFVPVDASSTSISVYVRYDTNHATTNKPQVQLQANGEIGVSAETKTATVGVDTWEQLTFSSFTPTAKGFVTVRLVSRSAAGNGIAYFDTFAGGASSTAGLDYFRRGEPFPAAVAGGSGGGGGAIFSSGVFGGSQ